MMSLKVALKALSMPGARLMFMHDNSSPSGKTYCIVPGGRVELETAERIIKRDDVIPQHDGLFPGHTQTWQFIRD